MSSLETTDSMSKAVQKTLHRVALADIEAAIVGEFHGTAHDFAHGAAVAMPGKAYTTAPDVEVPLVLRRLKNLSLCILVLRNGFVVIGKSAPADPANFDAALGRQFAREDAIRQLWPLMGFSLRDRLAAGDQPQPDPKDPVPGVDYDPPAKPAGFDRNGIPHKKPKPAGED